MRYLRRDYSITGTAPWGSFECKRCDGYWSLVLPWEFLLAGD